MQDRKFTKIKRRFLDLILDAIVLKDQARTAKEDWDKFDGGRLESIDINTRFLREALPRSSILYSLLSVECAANCCLERLSNVSNKLREALDKLTVLEKFELFAIQCQENKEVKAYFDRSRHEVQAISELINVRNWMVHPKHEIVEHTSGKTTSWKNWNVTQLNKSYLWDYADADRVLNYVVNFMNWYFLDVCQLSQYETTSILLTSLQESGQINPPMPSREEEKEWRILRGQSNIRFLDLSYGIMWEDLCKSLVEEEESFRQSDEAQ